MKMKIVNVKEAKILALNFAIPFLSSDEYQAISTIEIQLKNISNDMQKLHKKEHYLHYKDIYEILVDMKTDLKILTLMKYLLGLKILKVGKYLKIL